MLQTPQCPKNPVLATFLEHNKNMGDLSNICLEPSTLDSETPSDTASRDDLNPEPASFPIALVDNGLAREMLVPPALPGRSIRVRVAPTRFDANPKRKRVRTFTPEQKVQYDTNSVLREQMRYNDDTIWKNAIAFSCPLLRAWKIEAGDFEENDLLSLLGTQMRQVAVADDGNSSRPSPRSRGRAAYATPVPSVPRTERCARRSSFLPGDLISLLASMPDRGV